MIKGSFQKTVVEGSAPLFLLLIWPALPEPSFPNELVERSARTAKDRLRLKHTDLQEAEVRYAEASSPSEVLRAKTELIAARQEYSEIYLNYNEVLHQAGMTEIARYFGDLIPEAFTEKKA